MLLDVMLSIILVGFLNYQVRGLIARVAYTGERNPVVVAVRGRLSDVVLWGRASEKGHSANAGKGSPLGHCFILFAQL